jgi:hypothetical protein
MTSVRQVKAVELMVSSNINININTITVAHG